MSSIVLHVKEYDRNRVLKLVSHQIYWQFYQVKVCGAEFDKDRFENGDYNKTPFFWPIKDSLILGMKFKFMNDVKVMQSHNVAWRYIGWSGHKLIKLQYDKIVIR